MKRRAFLKGTTYAATFVLIPSSVFKSFIARNNKDDLYVYIGTYTNKGSEGIYICRYNQVTGQLSIAGVEKGVTDPSFLAVDTGKKFLFAVNEVSELKGKKEGGVSAFRIDNQSGMLRFINQQSSGGGDPCNIIVNNDSSFVLVGNYSGGNVSVLPVMPNGSLGSLTELIQHTGSGINLKRQKTPHVHCVVLDRSNKHIIVTDLGTDKIMVYPFDGKKGVINESGVHFVSAHPGAGPRHLAFSPDEKFLYAINELNSTITAYKYNNSEGKLTEIQTIPTLPSEFSGANNCADIHVHPSGKFLYGSNRGHDSIAAYKRDQETGMLSLIELVSTKGKNPRNFAIDPAGNFLLVANQDTNNIVSFRIDSETGRLSPSESTIDIPTPVCVRFI